MLKLSTKSWISSFNAQGSRGIIVAVQLWAVKIYVAAMEALTKKYPRKLEIKKNLFDNHNQGFFFLVKIPQVGVLARILCNQKRRIPRKQPGPSVATQSRLNNNSGWSGFTHTMHSHRRSTFRTPVLYLSHSDSEVSRHTVHNSTLTFTVTASIHTNYQNQTPPSRHSQISLYKS